MCCTCISSFCLGSSKWYVQWNGKLDYQKLSQRNRKVKWMECNCNYVGNEHVRVPFSSFYCSDFVCTCTCTIPFTNVHVLPSLLFYMCLFWVFLSFSLFFSPSFSLSFFPSPSLFFSSPLSPSFLHVLLISLSLP